MTGSVSGKLSEIGHRLGMFPHGGGGGAYKDPLRVAMRALALTRTVQEGLGRELSEGELETVVRTAWTVTPWGA